MLVLVMLLVTTWLPCLIRSAFLNAVHGLKPNSRWPKALYYQDDQYLQLSRIKMIRIDMLVLDFHYIKSVIRL